MHMPLPSFTQKIGDAQVFYSKRNQTKPTLHTPIWRSRHIKTSFAGRFISGSLVDEVVAALGWDRDVSTSLQEIQLQTGPGGSRACCPGRAQSADLISGIKLQETLFLLFWQNAVFVGKMATSSIWHYHHDHHVPYISVRTDAYLSGINHGWLGQSFL